MSGNHTLILPASFMCALVVEAWVGSWDNSICSLHTLWVTSMLIFRLERLCDQTIIINHIQG